MTLFGRSVPAEVDTVLSELLEATPDCRALACNLIHDQRVATPRVDALCRMFPEPLTRRTFEEAIKAYRTDHVRFTETPDFVDDQLNASNILAGTSLGEHQVSKDLRLGRVLNLSALRDFYSAARNRKIAAFVSVPDGAPIRVKKWIDDQMEEPRRAGFIKSVLENLWPNRHATPFEPSWATTWDALEAVADQDACRWAEVVGVRAAREDWLILLCYTLRETGTLVRPTQLDAGWDCFHFPSPPTTPLASGGHPMDLGAENCHPALHSEFIHMQIHHTIEHWEAAGCRAAQVKATVEPDVTKQRKRHWALLQERDGLAIPEWMPVPI